MSILSVNVVGITGVDLYASGQYLGKDGEDEISLVSVAPATIFGKRENDKISGNDAGDMIHGGKGFDLLIGNGSDDVLRGERGIDFLSGGAGNDTFVISGSLG